MSVTISPTQNGRPFPRKEVSSPCDMCAQGICQPGWCNDGIATEFEPTAPEVNFSNVNARRILDAVGLTQGDEIMGAISAEEVPLIIVEAEKVLESSADGMLARSGMLSSEVRSLGFLQVEQTDDLAINRLKNLLTLLRWAKDHNAGIQWD